MKTALIIIDVQNYYINENTKNIPSKIAKYIEENHFDLLVFTQFINHPNSHASINFNWLENQTSPEIDICNELKKYSNTNNTFIKDTYSAFKNKVFRNYLKNNSIQKLYICGFDSDACVLATSYEGFDLGYKIEVLENLTASTKGKKYYDSALMIIQRRIKQRT